MRKQDSAQGERQPHGKANPNFTEEQSHIAELYAQLSEKIKADWNTIWKNYWKSRQMNLPEEKVRDKNDSSLEYAIGGKTVLKLRQHNHHLDATV